jgi:hypothetical protein
MAAVNCAAFLYLFFLFSFYNEALAPIYRLQKVVVMESHDQGYPMIMAVSSSCSASHVVVMGGFFLSSWRSWW